MSSTDRAKALLKKQSTTQLYTKLSKKLLFGNSKTMALDILRERLESKGSDQEFEFTEEDLTRIENEEAAELGTPISAPDPKKVKKETAAIGGKVDKKQASVKDKKSSSSPEKEKKETLKKGKAEGKSVVRERITLSEEQKKQIDDLRAKNLSCYKIRLTLNISWSVVKKYLDSTSASVVKKDGKGKGAKK